MKSRKRTHRSLMPLPFIRRCEFTLGCVSPDQILTAQRSPALRPERSIDLCRLLRSCSDEIRDRASTYSRQIADADDTAQLGQCGDRHG